MKGPRELGEQYLRELRHLLDNGEIGAEFAQRIMDDFFEASEQGHAPRLKLATWFAYIENKKAAEEIRLRTRTAVERL